MRNTVCFVRNRITGYAVSVIACALTLMACTSDGYRYSTEYPCNFTFYANYHPASLLSRVIDNPGLFVWVEVQRKSGVNHDLNLRLDISFRKQASITRDIATVTSTANSGNSAFKLSFMADYTLSRLLTISAYYDRQTNTPLLASSSYPTTTQDFGVSLKFSLTR